MAAPLISLLGSSLKSFAKQKVINGIFRKNKKPNDPKPQSNLIGSYNGIKPNKNVTSIIVRPSSALVPKSLEPIRSLSTDNILLSIRKKVLEIENIVTADFLLRKRLNEKERIAKEEKKFKKEEDKLEKGIKLPFKISIPGKGLYDNIMSRLLRFFSFIFLGSIFPLLTSILPALKGIISTLGKIGSFFGNIFGVLLNGFMTFVEWGFKVRDGIKSIGNSIVGDGFEKTLNTFESTLTTFMNLALIAGMASANYLNDLTKTSPKSKGGRPPSTRTKLNYYKKNGRDQFIKRYGKKGLESLPGSMGRSKLTNLSRNALVGTLGKGGTKTLLKVIKPIAGKVPIIGGLIDFGLSWAMGDPVGRAAFKGVGTALLGALGAAIGGPFGMFLGGWAGSELVVHFMM